MKTEVLIYDTTLRDGAQAEGMSLSKNDKLRIAAKLDRLGVAYIEGGWPGSNPKDAEFFRKARHMHFKNARIAAFGSTRRAGVTAETDENLNLLVESEAPVVTIFGKSWLKHVSVVLRVSPAENLKMIAESCRFLADSGREVIFDAEHFFDGYADSKEYALQTVLEAAKAGASTVTLCDTNGGSLPETIFDVTKTVRAALPRSVKVGIHCHNDGGLAAANTLAAVRAGAVLVQGTINGCGERCGNTDLCTVIPNLELKLKLRCLPEGSLPLLCETSLYVDETANVNHNPRLPYVGSSAFAHKGGMHVNAVKKDPATFEHIPPETVGNRRRILVSELSGKSNLELKVRELGIESTGDDLRTALRTLKQRENLGYEYEMAEASFALLVEREKKSYAPFFQLAGWRVMVEKRGPSDRVSEATVKVRVGKEVNLVAAESHSGPVNALDEALRKALIPFYPELARLSLLDYKVRILSGTDGTAAKTRVLIESSSGGTPWVTVGVSENIINASCEALLDSIDYALLLRKKLGKH